MPIPIVPVPIVPIPIVLIPIVPIPIVPIPIVPYTTFVDTFDDKMHRIRILTEIFVFKNSTSI